MRTRDDGALTPHLLGARGLAAPRRPARQTAMRVGSAARGRRVVQGQGSPPGAWELPPQRDIGRSVAARVWRRWALPRPGDAGVY